MNETARDAAPGAAAPVAITLDLDDTLWPVRPTLLAAEERLEQWLARHAPATAARFDRALRLRLRERVLACTPGRAHDVSFVRREVLRLALLDSGDDPRAADTAFEVFLAARQEVVPYPDVETVLARWARRYRLVAITNGNANIARISCGRYFTAAINAPEAGCAKPDPRIFAAACEAAGAPASACLHIGDDWELDIEGARAIGMQVAWVRRPEFAHRPQPAATSMHPVPVFDSLAAVDDWLHPCEAGR